ncbi:NAD-dependent epimerase/dehydratase family protein [Rhabdochlamydiaceae symbiont of Dictyostelium giganteum]|uniref:NAD-dependent epimerase/dehydratase family protein n=1 Tax=Rhabdochlamydiaceae symbiont of Dictyostelium giganteum TaxID=3342349 RepID=UPI0038501E1F
MKILITGSKGLIGSALKTKLLSLGMEIIGIDPKAHISDVDYGDILDGVSLHSRIKGVHGVIHLGAVSRVIDGEKNRDLCWRFNVEGTKQVLKAASLEPSSPWVIYASSREVYGEPHICPVRDDTPLKPVNIYGESKKAAEDLIQEASQSGLTTSIIRFSNVFGSVHDHPNRVIPAFCRASATGAPIYIEGSHNVFDFTYLDDVIQGILRVIFLLSTEKQSLPSLHLTTGRGMSLGEVAEIAKKESFYDITLEERPSRSFDVARFWGDPALAYELLGWRASTTVEEGMKRLIQEYRLHLGSFP